MKHLKYISTALAAALTATSCSKEACQADGGTDGVPVTFTATVDYAIGTPGDDTAPAATRATSDEDDAPTRFYAQALSAEGTLSDVVEGTKNDDGSYSFTFQVFTGKEYGYMFWADNATTDDEPPTFGAYHTPWATSHSRPKRRVRPKQSTEASRCGMSLQK